MLLCIGYMGFCCMLTVNNQDLPTYYLFFNPYYSNCIHIVYNSPVKDNLTFQKLLQLICFLYILLSLSSKIAVTTI